MNKDVTSPQRGDTVVVIGAGFAGLYMLYRLRQLGYDAVIVEAGSGVGGTWYWNRYPGARVDIESVEYSYSFSEELQQEWEWSERYAAQPELLRYLNHVTDRFDLRPHIRFNQRVRSAVFDEGGDAWDIEIEGGESLRCRYVVMATGFLSAPNRPNFPGFEKYQGQVLHTAAWPREGFDFSGMRVGIIGTGSSAIQTIPIVAQQAEHLTVFQRTPAFSIPLRNCPMPADYQARVKAHYAEWRAAEKKSAGGWVSVNWEIMTPITVGAMDVSDEERRALFDDRWESGGLAFYNTYPDVASNIRSNEALADYMREKIRSRVNDPATAELLCPKTYPVLTKRLCADTNYYETYNRENVALVDIRSTPVGFTETGVHCGGKDYAFDAVIVATGYDALTGALTRIDIRGRGGRTLSDHWQEGARTAYGLMIAGFPNMFLMDGPGCPSPFYQPILLSEEQGDWIGDWLVHMDAQGLTSIEPSAECEDAWVQHCTEAANATLFPEAPSWYMGANIPGKGRIGLAYFGGMASYRQRCEEIQISGFNGFEFGSLDNRSKNVA